MALMPGVPPFPLLPAYKSNRFIGLARVDASRLFQIKGLIPKLFQTNGLLGKHHSKRGKPPAIAGGFYSFSDLSIERKMEN
jgi:hypothetical protein